MIHRRVAGGNCERLVNEFADESASESKPKERTVPGHAQPIRIWQRERQSEGVPWATINCTNSIHGSTDRSRETIVSIRLEEPQREQVAPTLTQRLQLERGRTSRRLLPALETRVSTAHLNPVRQVKSGTREDRCHGGQSRPQHAQHCHLIRLKASLLYLRQCFSAVPLSLSPSVPRYLVAPLLFSTRACRADQASAAISRTIRGTRVTHSKR